MPAQYLSPYNSSAAIVEGEAFPRRVTIMDETLRDGEQAADIAFSAADKVKVAQGLADAGVPYIQVGFASADSNLEVVRELKAQGVSSKLSLLVEAFGRGWREEIVAAGVAGVDVIEIVARSGRRQLAAMGLQVPDSLRQAEQVLTWAGRHANETWLMPSYLTLAHEADIRAFCQVAVDAGARRLTMTDSTGVAKPATMRHLVGVVREASGDMMVGLHCHNDFGLALANTLAGLEAGADSADVTINGYGERSGNCALQELAAALELLYEVETGIDLTKLTGLAQLTRELAGAAPPTPITGENAFAQKLDSHVKLTQNDPTLLEPYAPELVGNRRELRLGVGSGPRAIELKLAELGLELPDDEGIGRLAELVQVEARKSSPVSDEILAGLLAAR